MKKRVKFNDNFIFDGLWVRGQEYDVTAEQFDFLSRQVCGYNKSLPLITDITVKSKSSDKPAEKSYE
jgi:hypothetical protein